MKLNTAIFDMDGLLIDSEPLWYEAAIEELKRFDAHLEQDSYNTTTGLRTQEFLHHWFSFFKIDMVNLASSEKRITEIVISKVIEKGELMSGVHHALTLIKESGYKIGLASSSPLSLIETVINKTGLKEIFSVISSAEFLPLGKPHPQVYLNCAAELGSHPTECFCIEDSFNGLIAAKAARMKCIIVPNHQDFENQKWYAADLKLTSLSDINTKNLLALNK